MKDLSYNTLYDKFLSDFIINYFKTYYNEISERFIAVNLLSNRNELDQAYELVHMHSDITSIGTTKDTILFPIQALYEVKHRVYRKECALYFPPSNDSDDLDIDLNKYRSQHLSMWSNFFDILPNIIYSMYKGLARYFLKDVFNLNNNQYKIKLYKVLDDFDYFVTPKEKLSHFYEPFILYSSLNDINMQYNIDTRNHETFNYRFIMFPFSNKVYCQDVANIDTIKLDIHSFLSFDNMRLRNFYPIRFIIGNCFNKLLIVAYDKDTNKIVNTYHFDSRGNGNSKVQIIWNRKNQSNIKGPFTFSIIDRYIKDIYNDIPLEFNYYTDLSIDIKEINYLRKE